MQLTSGYIDKNANLIEYPIGANAQRAPCVYITSEVPLTKTPPTSVATSVQIPTKRPKLLPASIRSSYK